MDDNFHRDPFSYPFNILIYLGNWPIVSDNPLKKKLYTLYRLVAAIYEWQLVIIGFIDLYLSLNNFKRIVYNLCVTFFTTTLTAKNIFFLRKANEIDKFRVKLFRIAMTLDDNDVKILNRYRYFLKTIRYTFYTAFCLFAPLWLLSSILSLKWGPRELPFPLWLPLNLEDNRQFGFGFFYHTIAAIIFLGRAIHAELCMFSLILQTTGHYIILEKNLMKINDFYSDNSDEVHDKGDGKKEVNKFLTRVRVKKKLKALLRRQMELKQRVKEIECFLHVPMMLELFGGLLLSVTNGFELIEATMDFSFKLSYQMAYTIIVLTDLYACCLLADNLMEASKTINSSLYNLKWYEMENDVKKDIMMMIIGAQRIERLTVGKFFTLNLSTYLGVIKNLYSWLTVFRTVAQKK